MKLVRITAWQNEIVMLAALQNAIGKVNSMAELNWQSQQRDRMKLVSITAWQSKTGKARSMAY